MMVMGVWRRSSAAAGMKMTLDNNGIKKTLRCVCVGWGGVVVRGGAWCVCPRECMHALVD